MLNTLVRFESYANKFARSLDEFFLREQTVLRFGVTRSEDARNSPTGRGGGHEKNGPIGSLCFCQSGVPSGVPRDPRFADGLRTGPQISGPWALGKRG